MNLPSPAMLFSNGEEHPSTASSPQSAPETPESNSSDIAEPSGLPSQLHHNWNSWNALSTAGNQIALEDIIHESAIIESVLLTFRRHSTLTVTPVRMRIFNPQIPPLPRKIFYSIVTHMYHHTLYTRPNPPPSRLKRLLSFKHSHQLLSSILLSLVLFKRLPRSPQRAFHRHLVRYGPDFQP